MLYIDYGNVDTVPTAEVAPLSHTHSLPPPYAIRCRLSGLKSSTGDQWRTDACASFKEVTTDKKLLLEIVNIPEDESNDVPPVEVKLWDMGKCVARTLVDDGYAVECGTSTELDGEAHNADTSSAKPVVQKEKVYLSPECTEDVNIDTTNLAEIARNLDFEAEDNSKAENTTASKEDFATEVTSLDKVRLPQTRVQACISHAISPSQFWVQLESNQSTLDELRENMALVYGDETRPTPSPDIICTRMYVAAKSAEDRTWYRAQVSKVTEEAVTVLYVDYGNSEEVLTSDIRRLSSSLAQPAAQAVECMLDGIHSLGCSWTSRATEQFLHMTSGKNFMVDQVSTVDVNLSCIRLLDMGVSVGDKLIEAEWAVDGSVPVREPHTGYVSSCETDQQLSNLEATREEAINVQIDGNSNEVQCAVQSDKEQEPAGQGDESEPEAERNTHPIERTETAADFTRVAENEVPTTAKKYVEQLQEYHHPW